MDYKGIWDRWGYKGFEEVTGGNRWLQSVTRDNRELQGVVGRPVARMFYGEV